MNVTVKTKMTKILYVILVGSYLLPLKSVEATTGRVSHLGTFEGSTTFETISSNDVQPGLLIEVTDNEGNLTQYQSEEGKITIPNTHEGAYVTQAKLLGKTKYLDETTGEWFDECVEPCGLTPVSPTNPQLKTTGKNLFNIYGDVNQKYNGIIHSSNPNTVLENTVIASSASAYHHGRGQIIPVEKDATYTLSYKLEKNGMIEVHTPDWINFIIIYPPNGSTMVKRTFKAISDEIMISFNTSGTTGGGKIVDFQLEKGAEATNPIPYQSNLTTISESLTLEETMVLDLVKGEYVNPSHDRPVIKRITPRSTYTFNQLFVQVSGIIQPLIGSVTIPTDELTFTLDPNQEAGQQFIAPEFEVTNESNAPLTLTLKTFEQTTDVLNDVLPSEHDSWNGLSKEQSKDIALGLIAKTSNGWLSYVDTPHYVSNTTNKFLGTIKPNETIDFGFVAHHGQAFSETLSPSYRLTFVFDLLN